MIYNFNHMNIDNDSSNMYNNFGIINYLSIYK